MSRVIFHLTDAQAGALLALERGGRIAAFHGSRGKPALLDALRERGFIDAGQALTDLGRAAARLAAILTKASHTGARKQGSGEGGRE